MVIGVLQFELLIPGASSLKDKRRVVRSVKDRLHREHLVSVAEVGMLDRLDVAVLGLAAVGGDGDRIGRVLDTITAKLRSNRDAELGDCYREVLSPTRPAEEPDPDVQSADIARELLDRMREGPAG